MFFPYKVRIALHGLMPERALLRLRRAGIPLFDIQKVAKDELHCSIRKKDSQKVFAIYPKVCYNISEYTPYMVTELGAVGIGKAFELLQKRVGICIGCLLFALLTVWADDFVFGVHFVTSDVYARETYAALEEYGVRLGRRYQGKNADLICAKLLSLDSVEFCSLQKKGMYLYVDIRTAPFGKKNAQQGVMGAKRTGKIVGLTVLRGTALKKVGEEVQAGEPLVGDWFSTEEGGQVRVEIIARVRIACTYEEKIAAESEEEAFALAYLQAGLTGTEYLDGQSVQKEGDGYLVALRYTVVESMNF